MADYSEVKGKIREFIKPNGKGEITASQMQEILMDVVNTTESGVNEVSNELANKSNAADVKSSLQELQGQLTEQDGQIENKANQDGKYPSLTSGFASNLVGRGESTESEFTFRASGGKSIEDGAARISELRGNGVVWNQLAKKGLSENGVEGWCFSGNGISGLNYDALKNEYSFPCNGPERLYTRIAFLHTHKYLVAFDIELQTTNTYSKNVYVGYLEGATQWLTNAVSISEFINKRKSIATIVTANSDKSRLYLGLYQDNLTSDDTQIISKPIVHDLTLMFGAGNEPTTIEEFNARKPIGVDEFAYNEGEVIPFNADAIKSVGDNLFNEDIMSSWEGITKTDDGWVGSTEAFYGHNLWENTMRYSGQIALVGKLTGTLEGRPTIRVFYTDGTVEDFFKVSTNTTVEGNGVTTSGKIVDHIKVLYAAISDMTLHYLMISLAHSGWKAETDGSYKPYEDFVREIDPRIKDAFPNGMKPWDKVYNKNGKGYIVKGSGEVAMKDIKGWGVIQYSTHTTLYALAPKDAFNPGNHRKDSLLCSNAPSATWSDMYAARAQGIGMADAYMRVYIDGLTDVASAQAYFQDATLWYELADEYKEVIEYDEPFNLDYEVWDFGTEEILSEQPSAPISADIIYQFNAVDTIRNNQIEIAQLKAMIATMQAQMASMVSTTMEE